MDNRDICLAQKLNPMLGKIPEAEAKAYNHRGPINTRPQIDHCCFTRKVNNIMVWAPWQGGLLNLSYN